MDYYKLTDIIIKVVSLCFKLYDMETLKKFWGEYRWGVTCAFTTALLVAEQDRLLTAAFFTLATSVALFIFDKMYKS